MRIGTSSKTNAFTLVELLVVIGIIALLISMLMPALNRARDSANTLACLSNHKQLALLIQMYATENKGVYPMGSTCTDGSSHAGQGHMTRDNIPFGEFARMRGANKARRCTGPSGRHWNAVSKTLAPGSWWGGAGPDWEADSWITVNSRVCPRNDHWQQNDGWTGSNQFRRVQKTSYFRPASKIMATVDAYVPTQNMTGVGATPDENNDNCGDYGYGPERLRFRHGKDLTRINLSFLDGHAETWDYSDGSLKEPQSSWGFTSTYEKYLLGGDTRYYPWGQERTNPRTY